MLNSLIGGYVTFPFTNFNLGKTATLWPIELETARLRMKRNEERVQAGDSEAQRAVCRLRQDGLAVWKCWPLAGHSNMPKNDLYQSKWI
jgi:hypothetical protein